MKRELIEKNPILKKTLDFSVEAVEYCEQLQNRKKFVIAQQLLKCATSIGANCFEAQNAESKIDFIHKFKIAAKEAEETQYWLLICNLSKSYPDCNELQIRLNEVSKMITSIIKSSKQK